MSTVVPKLMTAEEFFDWVHSPGNEDRFFELERGEVVEMPPPTTRHGFVCANISRLLGNFAVALRKGYVCTNDSGVIVERNPDTVRGVDVTYYEGNVQTVADVEPKYATVPPVLAVEVLSPSDRKTRTFRRVAELVRMGVKQVWLVDPEARTLAIYRAGAEPERLTAEHELDAREVLPGFRCPVAAFFDAPSA